MGRWKEACIQLKMVVITAALGVAATAAPAWGSLGGDAASVQADQVHMRASRQTTVAEGYTVHEMHTPGGTVVKEFVSPDGKVFGVAWQGPWPPDMRQVLGSYFDQYVQAAQSRAGGRIRRGPVMIEQPGLVVHTGGHMRAFGGTAYIPEMLPSGVRAESIQ